MDNQSESNYVIPILSAIAGLGAILAAFSPIILQNNIFQKIFIDKSIVNFVSAITVIGLIVVFWIMTSNRSINLINDVVKSEKIKINGVVLFIILLIVFYASKPLGESRVVNLIFASIIQIVCYTFAFMSLAVSIGLLLRDSLAGFQWKQIESTRVDRAREAIIKSGKVKIDLEIVSLTNHQFKQGEPMDYISGKDIMFKTNDIYYTGILSNDYSTFIAIVQLLPQQGGQTIKSDQKSSKK